LAEAPSMLYGSSLLRPGEDGLACEQATACLDIAEAAAFSPTVARSPVTGARELVIGRRSALSG
jgi:hypothetical protein